MANTLKPSQEIANELIRRRYEERAALMLAEAKRIEQYARARFNADANHADFQEIARGVHEWVDRNEIWRVRFDAQANVTTVTYKGSEEEKKLGIVGTDGTRVVKLLAEDSYDYVRTDDFVERAKLIFSAVLADNPNFIKNHCASSDPVQLRQLLEKLQNHVIKAILQECEINIDELRRLDKKEREHYFIERHAKAQRLIAETLVDVANGLNRAATQTMMLQMSSHHYSPSQQQILNRQMEANLKQMIAAIKHQEIAYVAAKGRPHFLKVTTIDNQVMISAQFTQGEQTLPSSDRSGKYATKLSNHVLDLTGMVVTDLTGPRAQEEITIQFAVAGHSAYTPIAMEDELLRQQTAIIAVKEKLATTVKDIVMQSIDENVVFADDGRDEAHPLTIKLNTMMMLTPALERAVRKSASEYHQLLETHYALQAVQRLGTMEMTMHGEKRYVRLVVGYMNLPVNISERMGEVLNIASHSTDHLQSRVNQQGWYHYNKDMAQYLTTGFKNIAGSANPQVGSIVALYKAYQTAIQPRNDFTIAAEQVKIREEINNGQQALTIKYKQLADLLSHYHAQHEKLTADEKKQFSLSFASLKESIKQDELKQDTLYGRFNDLNKILFNSPEALALAAEMMKQIDSALQSRTGLKPFKRAVLLQQRRVLCLQHLYFSGDYKKEQNAYHFHALYLLTNQQAGAHVEAFCKNAEDSTGWLRIVCATYQTFYNLNGRDPNLAEAKDREQFNRLTAEVHNRLAVSLENTAANVPGARGLQVGGKLTNRNIGMSLGKMTAGLAKGIYKPTGLKSRMDVVVSHQLAEYAKQSSKNSLRQKASAGRILDTFKSFIHSSETLSPALTLNTNTSVYGNGASQLFKPAPPKPDTTLPRNAKHDVTPQRDREVKEADTHNPGTPKTRPQR